MCARRPWQFVAFALVFLVSSAAAAAWIPFGGPDPVIRNVRIFNNTPGPGTNTLFVATLGQGVLKIEHQSPGSFTVNQINTGLPSLRIRAVNATTTSQLFAATEAHGIYASSNGGASWSPINGSGGGALACVTVRNMTVISATEIYALTNCRYNSGVWKTLDGGANWFRLGVGVIPDDATISAISVFGTSNSVIAVATADYGVFRSNDGGVNFTQINNGLPAAGGPNRLSVLNVTNRSSSSEMIAVVEGAGVYVTSDSGANWTVSSNGLPSPNILAGVSRQGNTSPPTLYVGVDKQGIYRSTDNGATWSLWGNSAAGDSRLLFSRLVIPDFGTPNRYYVATFSGLFFTNDNGITFEDRGLPHGPVGSIALDPNGRTAYITADTVYKVPNVYSQLDEDVLPSDSGLPGMTNDQQIVVDRLNPSTVFVGVNNGGLHKSTNAGATWAKVTALPVSVPETVRITMLDSATSVIWAGLSNPFGTATGGGIYMTTDGGSTWTAKSTGLTGPSRNVNRISLHSDVPNTVFAATDAGLYRSMDGGASWAQVFGSIDAGGTPLPVNFVVRDPNNANIVYIANEHVNSDGFVLSSSGILKSTDNGNSWTNVLPNVRARQVRVQGDGELIAVLHHDLSQPPFMRSRDGGTTWQNLSPMLGMNDGRTVAQTNDAARRVVMAVTNDGIFLQTLGQNDFNLDNFPDIIWSNTANGATYVWHMTGPPPALDTDAFVAAIDPSWKVQGVADFNGDGFPDLVWRNTANGNTYVWYMADAAFISDAFLFGLPPEWVIQGVADFNADGKPDFLMRNTNSGVGFVWFFDNNVPIGDQFLFGIDPSWKVEQVGDVNADGQPDLLFRNMGSGLAFAWYTQYSGGNLSLAGSSPSIFSIDPVWEIVQLEDWNGDGERDLLFRNRDTGVVFVWYMTGTTLGGSDFVIQIDPSWEIVPRR